MSCYKVNVLGAEYYATHCITCGVLYVVPTNLWEEQRKMGGMHHCTNGHTQGWTKGGSEYDILKRERDRLAQQVAQKNDEIAAEKRKADKARRAAARAEGEISRQQKRAHAGLCSCCNRTFNNLARHMATKHPDVEVLQ